jgi:hypothetical protein
MIRNSLMCVLSCLTLALVGCAKSSEPQRAETAKGGLMPAAEPGYEAVYVVDQKDVKLAGAREVSSDPLSGFRERNAEAAKAREEASASKRVAKVEPAAKKAEPSAKDAEEPAQQEPVEKKVAKKASPSGKPGLIKRLKSAALGKLGLVPGGEGSKPGVAAGKPGGKPPAKAQPPKKEKEEKKKAEAEEEEDSGEE